MNRFRSLLKKYYPYLIVLVILMAGLAWKSLNRVEEIGRELLFLKGMRPVSDEVVADVPGVILVGPHLYDILSGHSVSLQDIKMKSQLCDCLGESFSVTHSIVITSPYNKLCIRLRYDLRKDKYHIVGYSGSID